MRSGFSDQLMPFLTAFPQDGSLVFSVGALQFATQRRGESLEAKEFSRYTVALLTMSYATLAFVHQKAATYELFALRGLRVGLGFDAPRYLFDCVRTRDDMRPDFVASWKWFRLNAP